MAGLKCYFEADDDQSCEVVGFCKRKTDAYRRVRAFQVLCRLSDFRVADVVCNKSGIPETAFHNFALTA